MKNLLLFIFFTSIIVSCKSSDDEAVKNEQIAKIKTSISKKKASVKSLEGEIEQLHVDLLKLEPRKEKAAVLVTIEEVNADLFERYTTVQAAVESNDEVFVSSETGGRLLSVLVKEGQNVKKGQLLVTVDLQILKDQRAELETSLGLAKDIFARQKSLWDQKIGSEVQFLQAKNSVERLENSLLTLKTQIGKANIYAPISGVVDREFLKAGEMSAPGAPILQLFNPNKLIVSADIPEGYLGKINRGDKVEVNFPAINKNVTSVVSLLGRTIDPKNRTFKVEITINNKDGILKPNLLAEVKFRDFESKDVIAIPLELVQQEVSGNKYVYTSTVVNGRDVAEKRYVTTGESYDGSIIIKEGLNVGDKIIMEGARTVADGSFVKEMNK